MSRHSKTAKGYTTMAEVQNALKAEGVQEEHKVTRDLPEFIEDPQAVADFMATHESPPVAPPIRMEAALLMESKQRELPITEGQFTEEELFRMRRRAAREKLREREDLL